MILLINIKGCMLYTTFTKFTQENKNKAHKSSTKESSIDDLCMPMTKNVLKCFKSIIRQKHGRKFLLKQAKQLNQKHIDQHQTLASTEISQIQWQKRKYFSPKCTLDWDIQPTTIKRHTQNHRIQGGGKQEHLDIEVQTKKKSAACSRNVYHSSVACKSQEDICKTPFEKKLLEIRAKMNAKGGSLPKKYQSKDKETKKKFLHSKYSSIQLQQSQEEQGSLVKLITKYQFQNLKTAPNTSSIEAQEQRRKYLMKLIRTQPREQAGIFFTEENDEVLPQKQSTQRSQNKTISHAFRKYQRSLISIGSNSTKPITRKSNPLLTPWVTDGDTLPGPLQ